MQARILVPLLLLFAAGCARLTDVPPPAAAAAAETAQASAQQAAPATPATNAGHVAAWRAFGNEPFWSVRARGGTLVFTTPEDQVGVTLEGRRVPSLVGTVILGSGPRGEFHLGITPGKCSDGMSDRSYDHASTFIYDGVTYKGCAELVE